MEINGQFVPKRLMGVRPEIEGLWFAGDTTIVDATKIVAIVGSRRMSLYGKRVLAEIVPKLIESGYVTISGFMYGIDIEMHRLTIENGGKTIGVLGWGIEAPILKENENLYHKIIESGGLFLSELEPKQLGTLWTFPQRNRIVVGLADMVIVVEAGIKSGSLNSAEWARKMKKPVYAVPGSIFSSVSLGCNYLIDRGLARPFSLDYFKQNNYSEKVRIKPSIFKNGEVQSSLVVQLRLQGPLSLNQLSRSLNKPVPEVSSALMSMLLQGIVYEEKGIWCLS